MAPTGKTLASRASLALFKINSQTERWSFTGWVFGMQATAAKPPATAA